MREGLKIFFDDSVKQDEALKGHLEALFEGVKRVFPSEEFVLALLEGEKVLASFSNGAIKDFSSLPPGFEILERPLGPKFKLVLAARHTSSGLKEIFEEEALRFENHLLRKELEELRLCCETISSALPQAITIHDTEMRVIKANQAACKLLGLPLEEIIGRKCYELFHAETSPPDYCPALKIFNGELKSVREVELDLYNRVVEINVSALTDEKGNLKGYVHVVIDLTEQKELKEKLVLAQKLEALGTLAGGIAHDFNNLLTPILGFAEVALLKTTDEGIKNYLLNIISCAKRAKEIIAQIQAFSHQGGLEHKPLLIEAMVKEGVKLIQAVLPGNIEIEATITPTGYILGNPTEIQQILLNLASNAFYAMRKRGGKLTIHLEPCEVEGKKFARLTVSDTGEGIPPEVLPRIFDPYFTTKPASEGTGLGLAVVHGIVKSSGGHIKVRSKPGRGTTFDLYFPILEEGNAEEKASEKELDSGHGERILILEDDEQNLKVLVEGLKVLGYEPIPCRSCDEALLKFFSRPEQFDLFLTDLLLPGTRGDLVASVIKENRPDLPVVLITGYHENVAPHEAVDEVLFKPVTLEDLAKVIKRLLNRKYARLFRL